MYWQPIKLAIPSTNENSWMENAKRISLEGEKKKKDLISYFSRSKVEPWGQYYLTGRDLADLQCELDMKRQIFYTNAVGFI